MRISFVRCLENAGRKAFHVARTGQGPKTFSAGPRRCYRQRHSVPLLWLCKMNAPTRRGTVKRCGSKVSPRKPNRLAFGPRKLIIRGDKLVVESQNYGVFSDLASKSTARFSFLSPFSNFFRLRPPPNKPIDVRIILSVFFLHFRVPRRHNTVTFDETFDVFQTK